MFCPYCGVELATGVGTCPACGRVSPAAVGAEPGVTRPETPLTPPDAVTVLSGNSEAATIGTSVPAGSPLPHVTTGGLRSAGAGAAAGSAALGVGTAFGNRYHIIRLLGMGGMGAVYQAWDDALGVAVALKVIRPEITADPAAARDLERRFKRELLLARQVTHKHVVRIHDLGEIDGIKYLTMPYIQGSDLGTILNREGRLSVPRAIAIARQVASGLLAAHEAGVVHRDLKPANVMIDADDQAVIMDFGIARSVSGGGATMAGAVVGTLEYMAPEQAMAQAVDHRADIYALGLMLYDMVLGPRQAARAESAVAELMARVQRPLRPAREIDPQIPEALERIIDRCTQPDPAARYQTTAQLLQDLELIDPASKTAGTRPLSAPPVTRPHEPVAPPKPRTVPLVAAAAVLALAAGLVAGWWLWMRPGDSASGGPPEAVKPVALAVLPFRNATGDAALDSLGPTFAHLIRDGIGDSVGLRIVSPDRVSRLLRDLRLAPNAEIDAGAIRRVGEFTSADSVVAGRFTMLANEFRFESAVYPAAGGEPVTLTATASSEGDMLRAAEQLAREIRALLAPADDESAAAFKPSSQSVAALRAYEEGLEQARLGEHLEAIRRFEEATKADPQFALAYAQLGRTLANLRRMSDAEAAARRALDQSASLPREEREMINAIHARIVNDLPAAIAAYERLLQARPTDVQLRFEFASLLDNNGDLERARDEYAKVLEADPKFPEALYAAGRNAILRADYTGSLEWFTRAQTLAAQLDNQEAQARVLHALGVAYKNLGRLDQALQNYQASLAIRRRLGDTGGIAQSLNELAQVHDLQGRSADAMASYEEAIEVYRTIGNRDGLGLALNNLGAFYLDRGRYGEALKVLKEALPIQRELGNADRQALCLHNIGNAYAAQGDYLGAITYLERALELRERLNAPGATAEVLASLGEVSVLLGEYDRAQRDFLRAIELSRGAGDRRGEALGSIGLGNLHRLQGRLAAALGAHADALKAIREVGDRSYVLVQALAGYGASLSAAGRFDEASKHLEEAAAVAKQLRSGSLVTQTLTGLGDNAFHRGDVAGARAFYAQAVAAAKEGAGRYDMLRASVSAARTAAAAARAAELKKLMAEADALDLEYTSAECSLHAGIALVETGSTAAARSLLESALRKADKLGARLLAAQAHHQLARLPGASAADHAAKARQILDAVRGELKDDAVLERADLKGMLEGR